MPSNLSYGIDFGTTNSTIALISANNEKIEIPIDRSAQDPAVMRSVIYVDPNSNFSFGAEAVKNYLEAIKKSSGTEYKSVLTGRYIKVLTSTGGEELVPEIVDTEVIPTGRFLQSLKSALSNHAIKKINLFGTDYLIEEIVGKFLLEMKTRADKEIGEVIDTAVIGRPIEYVGNDNELALKRMQSAAKYAGFKNVVFEYEPIGAAYDYGVNIHTKQTALIFDFGGGTLDISIVKFPEKEILANVGIKMGGDYFDSKIFSEKLAHFFGKGVTYGKSHIELPSHIFSSLESWYGITLLKSKEFLNSFESFRFMCSDIKPVNALKSLVFNNLGFKMYDEIERVKKSLTVSPEATYQFFEPNIQIDTTIKKLEFEKIIEDDLQNINDALKLAILNANLKIDNIDYVVTTGGSSLIPVIQELLVNFFDKEKIKTSSTFTSVASGLAQIAKISATKS